MVNYGKNITSTDHSSVNVVLIFSSIARLQSSEITGVSHMDDPTSRESRGCWSGGCCTPSGLLMHSSVDSKLVRLASELELVMIHWPDQQALQVSNPVTYQQVSKYKALHS